MKKPTPVQLFGRIILEKRSKIQITTEHMAKLLDIEEKLIIQLENTNKIKTVQFSIVDKFSKVFDVDLFELVKKLGWGKSSKKFFKDFPVYPKSFLKHLKLN